MGITLRIPSMRNEQIDNDIYYCDNIATGKGISIIKRLTVIKLPVR